MTLALAFDIYGTLINPHGVVDDLTRHLGDDAQAFSTVWRDKQLEYSFRRGLMGRYEDFPTCTRQALEYTDRLMQTGLAESVKNELMQRYRKLPMCRRACRRCPGRACACSHFPMARPMRLAACCNTRKSTSISKAWSVSMRSGPLNRTRECIATSSRSLAPMSPTAGWFQAMPSM